MKVHLNQFEITMAVLILICRNLCSGRQLFFKLFWRITSQKEGLANEQKVKKMGKCFGENLLSMT